MKLPVAILAGGLATRMRPKTETIPKSLIDIGGKPFAVHQVELLARNGIRHVVFCVGHLGKQIVDLLGNGNAWNIRIDYAFDGPVQLGTGGAIKNALPFLGDRFLILYGDSYLECDYAAIEACFIASGRSGLMVLLRNMDQWDLSNVHFSGGVIHSYDKESRTKDMKHIDYGLGALCSEALLKYSLDRPLDLVTVYKDLIASNEMVGFEVTERFYEIGSPSGLEETRRYLSLRRNTTA
jgi:NDP-sugar pyrophosphorylase family protein